MEAERLKALVKKYLEGTASPAEREELNLWYQSQTETEFLWPYKNEDEAEKARAQMLGKLKARIDKDQNPKRKSRFSYLKYAAAAAIMLIGAGLIFYRLRKGSPDDGAATLTITATRAGEHKVIKLADGTTIWLSAGSLVRYPSAFDGPTREISFEGEAFFDVAKDKKHPFIVHAGKTSTRVLGTTFNITALANKSNITVALITGKVAFSDGRSELKLFPGQQVVYNKVNNNAKLQDIPDMADVVSRKEGDYEYKNVSVADVIDDVNLNFNLNIQVEGKVKSCPFFGRLKPGETPAAFMKKLAVIVNAKVVQTNSGYIIKGGGCD